MWADLCEVTSSADLVLRLDQALAGAPGPFAATARTVAASLHVSLGVARVEFSRPARQQPNPAARLSALLDILVRAARSTPTLLVIDEFSSIAAVRGGAGMLAGPLLACTGGPPQRTMQLADAAWRRTGPGETVDEQRWGQALTDARAASAEGMERLFSHFDASQRNVLRIVASGGSLYGGSARLLELSSSSAANAKARLLADGDLIDGPHGLVVTDPLLGDWLRTVLPL